MNSSLYYLSLAETYLYYILLYIVQEIYIFIQNYEYIISEIDKSLV